MSGETISSSFHEEPSSAGLVDSGDFSFKATLNASQAHDRKDPGSSNHNNVEEFIEDDEFAETAENESAIKYGIEHSEKDGVVQIDPERNNPENAERLVSDRNEEAVSDASKERNGDSDISFENQNYRVVKEKNRGSQMQSVDEPNMGIPTTTSNTTKAHNLVEDNVVLMALSQSAHYTSKEMKSSFGGSTVAKEMGHGCFGAVQPLGEGNSVLSNVIMAVDADQEFGLCENKNENISKAMEGMCQADASTAELGYQEMGNVITKGTEEEAIVPCSEIAVRAEAAHENTGSFSFDPAFVHVIHVTDSIGMDGYSSVINLDMGTLGFSPEKLLILPQHMLERSITALLVPNISRPFRQLEIRHMDEKKPSTAIVTPILLQPTLTDTQIGVNV
ncbi:hypothetical protein ACLOJK_033110 [Asimina triloba]